MDAMAKVQKAADHAKQAEELRRQPAASRRAFCAEVWTSWLREYRQRLQAEDEAATAGTEGSVAGLAAARREAMRSVNPRVVLRNWVAQVRRGPRRPPPVAYTAPSTDLSGTVAPHACARRFACRRDAPGRGS